MTSGCTVSSFEFPEHRSSLLIAIEVPGSTISVHGELDCSSAPLLDESLHSLLPRTDPARDVTLSLRGITFIDSYGVQAVADAVEVAAALGRRIVVQPPAERIARVFRLAGAADLVDVSGQFRFRETDLDLARVESLPRRVAR